jgi:hypothetical protein
MTARMFLPQATPPQAGSDARNDGVNENRGKNSRNWSPFSLFRENSYYVPGILLK